MKLGVNIDHVATLRQARRGSEPDPVHAAVLCELGGADGITVHLRSDRRHIQDRDVDLLKRTISTRLNLEMAATSEMVEIAAGIQPWQATLVPERPNEVTTEGGLDVVLNSAHLHQAISRLNAHNIRVSLFVDPVLDHIRGAHKVGAQAVELNTNAYALARGEAEREKALRAVEESARLASKLGLSVLAGHALNYRNVGPVAAMPLLEELNIGHAILARAVFVGLERAVAEMKTLLVQYGAGGPSKG
jgi:pyridoxine 5-phosphate synthase